MTDMHPVDAPSPATVCDRAAHGPRRSSVLRMLAASPLLTAAALGGTATVTAAPVATKKKKPASARSTIMLQAHRGGKPDSSIRGMTDALVRTKVDELEVDVQESSDGRLLISHDDRLGTDSNQPGLQLHTKPWAWLEANVLINGQPIPLLDEVLALAARHSAHLFIEAKMYSGQSRASQTARARKILDRLHTLPAAQRRRIQLQTLAWELVGPVWKAARTDIRWWALETRPLMSHVDAARALGAAGYASHVNHVTVAMVQHIHRRGMAVRLWGTETDQTLRYAADMGVEAFGTDSPDWGARELARTRTALLAHRREVSESVERTVVADTKVGKGKRLAPTVIGTGLVPATALSAMTSVTLRIRVSGGSGKGTISLGALGSAKASSTTVKMPKGTRTLTVQVPVGDGGRVRIIPSTAATLRVEVTGWRHLTY